MEQGNPTLVYKHCNSNDPLLRSVPGFERRPLSDREQDSKPARLPACNPTVGRSPTAPFKWLCSAVSKRQSDPPTSLSAHGAGSLHPAAVPPPLPAFSDTLDQPSLYSRAQPPLFTLPPGHSLPSPALHPQRTPSPARSRSVPTAHDSHRIAVAGSGQLGGQSAERCTGSHEARMSTTAPVSLPSTSGLLGPRAGKHSPVEIARGDFLFPGASPETLRSVALKKKATGAVYESQSRSEHYKHQPLQTTTTAPSDPSSPALSRRPSLSALMASGLRLHGWGEVSQPPVTREQAKTHVLLQMDKLPPNFLRKTAETMEGPLPPPKRPGPVYGNSPSTPLLSEPGEPVGSVHASAYAGPCERISAEARTSREETAAASAVGRVLPLGSMVAMAVLCNFDHGVIPAVLSDIQEHFDAIGYIEQSLLGSLVYVGVVSGTFLAGVSTNCMGAKWLLVASLLAASAASYGFSCARSLAVMYTARFFVGFCQALPVVYLPVWVDSFAPDGKKTRWMAYSQLGSIGGSVVGYFLGGILSRVHGGDTGVGLATSWRTPFQIQAIALLPVVGVLACLPTSTINVPYHTLLTGGRWTEDSLQQEELPASSSSDVFFTRIWHVMARLASGAKSLLRNPLYVVITLGMSILYFVVTGIQFWVTEYMVVVLRFNKMTVVALSSLCFLTAPTSGVWCGGCICDLCGGYRQQRTAVRVATLFAGLASVLAVASAYVTNLFLFAVLLWGCLFCGGALVPVAVGILLSSVPLQQRSLSSAISQFSYNVLGWFAAPIISGAVMDTISTWQAEHIISVQGKELPLSVGFTMILCMSFLGFALFAVANLLTLLPSEEVEKEELEFGLARSRMPTLSF